MQKEREDHPCKLPEIVKKARSNKCNYLKVLHKIFIALLKILENTLTRHCLKLNDGRSHQEELGNTDVWKKVFRKS